MDKQILSVPEVRTVGSALLDLITGSFSQKRSQGLRNCCSVPLRSCLGLTHSLVKGKAKVHLGFWFQSWD